MSSIYENQKEVGISPSFFKTFSNIKSNPYNFDFPEFKYNFPKTNKSNRNPKNKFLKNNYFSEESYNPRNGKVLSIISNLEDDLYNSNNKNFHDSNRSNGMKKFQKIPYNLKGQFLNLNALNNLNNNLNLNFPNKSILDYKLSQLNTEVNAINSNNLMLKEDIYKYTDMNKYLENEIKIQREHNKDLINTNEHLIEDNNNLNNKLINCINELKDLKEENDKKQKEYDNNQKNLDIKNIKINNNYEELLKINNKVKNDYNILCQNFEELNKKNNNTKNELNLIKESENKNLSEIKEKINNILSEIDKLKKEQNDLNNENKENKYKFDLLKKEKDNFYNKYQEQMILNKNLEKELYNNKINLSIIIKNYKEQKDRKINKKLKNKPSSLVKRNDIIKDLQKKINDYKIRSLRDSLMND